MFSLFVKILQCSIHSIFLRDLHQILPVIESESLGIHWEAYGCLMISGGVEVH